MTTRQLIGVVIALALILTGCGGTTTTKKAAPLATNGVEVPEGLSATRTGTKLELGAPAFVGYAASETASSFVSISVDSIQQVRPRAFAGYTLDEAAATSTPYFVHVTITNRGSGDLGGAPVPLHAVNQDNALVEPTTFANRGLEACPSGPLPTPFAPQAAVSTCLVYLVSNQGTLTGLSFRPDQSVEGITWSGAIQPPPPLPTPAPKKHKHKKKKKKRHQKGHR